MCPADGLILHDRVSCLAGHSVSVSDAARRCPGM